MSEHRFSIANRPAFPHIKLTNELFPRALATRILKNDDDEYFGAFLNRTAVRILIDFLNRTFRLRSCTIEIDGSFASPCTQYYLKRCVAPCVASLCDREGYLELVDLVRIFLRNDRELFVAKVTRKIDAAAGILDFETARVFRDILQDVEKFWSNPRWHIWLYDAVDTFELHADDEAVYVIIVTQRGRRTLGELVYSFAGLDDPLRALRDVIDQFYRFHLPREIRVPHDFDDRDALANELGSRFGRKIAIVVSADGNRRVTAERAIQITKARLDLESRKNRPTTTRLIDQTRRMFRLSRDPNRIEAFDVAHISATGFAAAVSVWELGNDLPDEYEHAMSNRESELDTLREFVAGRVRRTSPDLILIDGGRSQLRAALEASRAMPVPPDVIAAVKPRGKHGSISYFLLGDGTRIEFDPDDHSHRLMLRMRDEAHDLANASHRLGRDTLHYYELAAMLPSLNERERQQLLHDVGSIRKIASLDATELEKRFGELKGKAAWSDLTAFHEGRSPDPRPLIVPIRFVETDGSAEDLIPIKSR